MRSPALVGAAVAAVAAVLALASTAAAAVEFIDVTDESGVDFVHTGGGEYPWFPEMMGGGACFFDADGDGFDDLLLVNGAYHNRTLQERYRPTSELFLSNGDGTFRDGTRGSGFEFEGFAAACSVADYDGDACLDVYVSGYNLSRLLRNRCDATFVDATEPAGVLNDWCPDEYPCFAHSSAWADFDRDGDLDLYVANYVRYNWTPELSEYSLNGPGFYLGQPNKFYRNDGDGTFTDVSNATGLAGPYSGMDGKSLGVAWQDWNLDGWPDVYVANDETPAFLFQNNGNGTFTDVAPEWGVDYLRAGMGVAWGDWDNNGCSDLIATHFIGEMDGFIRNYCTSLADESGDVHGVNQTIWDVRWGVSFVDYDNDAWRDIIIVSGDVYYSEDQAARVNMPPTAYRNAHDDPDAESTFLNDTFNLGPDFPEGGNSRGAAFADFDFDGGIDFVEVNNANQSARLLRSTGQTNNWIEIEVRDPSTALNRYAIGARVNVTTGDSFQVQQVFPGSSYLSSNSLYLHFGLADATQVDGVRVTWPDGTEDVVGALAANAVYRIERGGGVTNDTVAPLATIHRVGTPGANPEWISSGAGFSTSAEDRGVTFTSGVAERWCRIDGGVAFACDGEVSLDDGVYDVDAWAVDVAGNRGPSAREIIRVDGTPPVTTASLSRDADASGWHVEKPVLTLTATDGGSGVARIEYRFGDGAWATYAGPLPIADGEHVIAYRAVDEASNVEAASSIVVSVDSVDPVLVHAVDGAGGANGWWRSAVTVTLTASDATSGVAEFLVRVDGGDAVAYAGPIAVTTDARHEIEYRVTDVAGRVLGWHVLRVDVDATAPTSDAAFVAEDALDGWKRRVTMALSGSDATSGVARLLYAVNGSAPAGVTGPLDLPDGDLVVDWFAEDVAGNLEVPHSTTFRVDGTAPTTTAALEGPAGESGWWKGPVDVTLTATDPASGVARTWLARDGGAALEHDGSVERVSVDGLTTLRFWSDDVAGNAEAAGTLDVRVDAVPPTAALVIDGEEGEAGWWARAAPRPEFADATSGLSFTEFLVDGAAWTPGEELPEGVHRVTMRARDVAGHEAPLVDEFVGVDGTPPTTSFGVAAGPSFAAVDGRVFVTSATDVSLSALDRGSGVDVTWFTVDDGAARPYTGPFSLDGAGAHALTFWSVDRVGHVEEARTVTLVVDDVAPAIEDVTPAARTLYATHATMPLADAPDGRAVIVGDRLDVAANVSDGDGAGVRRVEFLLDGVVIAGFDGGGALTASMRLGLLHAGEHELVVRATDQLGNARDVHRGLLVVTVPWSGLPL